MAISDPVVADQQRRAQMALEAAIEKDGDSFVLKVIRKNNPNIGGSTTVARFREATLEHMLAPEVWLSSLLGKGSYAFVPAHSKATTKTIDPFLTFSIAGEAEVDPASDDGRRHMHATVDGKDWSGPHGLIFPTPVAAAAPVAKGAEALKPMEISNDPLKIMAESQQREQQLRAEIARKDLQHIEEKARSEKETLAQQLARTDAELRTLRERASAPTPDPLAGIGSAISGAFAALAPLVVGMLQANQARVDAQRARDEEIRREERKLEVERRQEEVRLAEIRRQDEAKAEERRREDDKRREDQRRADDQKQQQFMLTMMQDQKREAIEMLKMGQNKDNPAMSFIKDVTPAIAAMAQTSLQIASSAHELQGQGGGGSDNMAGFLELGKEAAKGFTALMQARAVEASSKVKVPQQLAPAQSRPVQPGQQQLPAPAPQPTPEQIAQAQARARQLQAEAAARAAQQQAPQAKPAPVAAVEPVATEGRPSETRLEELLRRVQSYENPETVAHSFYSYVQSDFGLQNEMNAVGGDPVALFSKYLEPWAMANLAKAGPYAMELNRQIEKVGQELGLLEVEEEEGEEEVDGAEQAGAAVNEAVNGALVAAEVVPPPAEELQQAQA